MVFRNSLGLTIFLCVGLATGRSAQADTSFKFLTGATDRSGTAYISTNGGISYEDVYLGQYQIQLGSGTNAKSLFTYCVDVQHDILVGDTTRSKLINFTDSKSGFATAGYNNGADAAAKQKNANAVAYLLDSYLNHSITTAKSIDVSLSIWDIVNDNGNGLTAGKFQVKADGGTSITASNYTDVVTDVNQLIKTAYSADPKKIGGVTWVDNPKLIDGTTRYQDYGIHTLDAVPEFSTLLGFGSLLALGGVATFRKRK